MSWEELAAIWVEVAELARHCDDTDPHDCDVCGTLLDENSHGTRRCPFCGWQPIC